MEIAGYLAAVAIGMILGILGGGGSILSIPILVYLFGVDAIVASAYSLFIVGVTSFVGAIPKYKDHLVDVRTGIMFGIPSIISIFATRKWIVPALPDIVFKAGSFIMTKQALVLTVFAVLMILASYSMISTRREQASDNRRTLVFPLILEGIVIGFLTGFVGAGGGFLIIPALVLLTNLPFKSAVGTSLFIIAINSLMGFLGDVLNYRMDWPFLLSISVLAITGIFLGHALQKKVSAMKLRKWFGWFILLMGSWILIKEIVVQIS